jgi:dTDP-4-amino-4,6-dideoxygalactose transaminase
LAVPNPIIWLGAKPVFVDIEPNTFNIDPSKIEEKITNKTKAIVVQHTFGVPAEMDKIKEIAKRYNLYLIEDTCHAIGSKYKGQLVGFLGDASFFSFGWGKPVVAGIGGCAIINNLEIENEMKKIYEKIRECSLKESIWLRIQYSAYSLLLTPSLFWFIRGAYRFLSKMKIIGGTFLEDEFESKMPVEYIKKMPKIQKEVLMKELKRLDSLIDYRKRMVSEYKKMLSEIGIKTQKIPEYIEPVYLRYPILVNDKNRVVEEAQKNKIEIGDWYNTPVHPLIGENLKKIGYCLGSCQVAEDVAKKIITLPVYEKVKEKDMKRTIEFLSKHKEKIIKNY